MAGAGHSHASGGGHSHGGSADPLRGKSRVQTTPQCRYGCSGVCVLFVLYIIFSSGTPVLQDDLIVREVGLRGTLEHKRYFWFEGRKISPWHDLPLRPYDAPEYFTFVCEIPKGETAKFEINKEATWNPIVQDVKKGKLRHYHSPSLVNYGALPQTWEDPTQVDPRSGKAGDNDPLDVLEIGEQVAEVGEVYSVRVLGVLGMIDGDEIDYKIVAVRATEENNKIEAATITDASSTLGTFTSKLVQWFRTYKVPDGKPENEFLNDGKPFNRRTAVEVILAAHKRWKALAAREVAVPDDFWLGRPR